MSSDWMKYPRVKHRDWLKHCNIEDCMRLSIAGKVPDSIEGFLLVTACKHVLRCVYGTNLQAAIALLGAALWDKIRYPFNYLNCLMHRKQWEEEEIAEEIREIEAEIKGE